MAAGFLDSGSLRLTINEAGEAICVQQQCVAD
jgi:hypothetical protein